jgi:hypothetical protein
MPLRCSHKQAITGSGGVSDSGMVSTVDRLIEEKGSGRSISLDGFQGVDERDRHVEFQAPLKVRHSATIVRARVRERYVISIAKTPCDASL